MLSRASSSLDLRARLRLALGGLDDAAGLTLGAPDAAVAGGLVEQESDGKREGGDNRQHDPGRVHHRLYLEELL